MDEHSGVMLFHPNQVIKAADNNFTFNTDKRTIEDSDIWLPGFVRRVVYRVPTGGGNYDEFPMELVPFKMPAGKTQTLGAISYSAENVATYTPTLQNRILLKSGDLAGADALCRTIAGMMFADYYTHWTDNGNPAVDFHATALEAGDIFWIIRRGLITGDFSGAVSSNGPVVTDANGELKASTALNTGGTIAQYNTTLLGHVENQNAFTKVGEARQTVGGAGQGKFELMLPRDFRQV